MGKQSSQAGKETSEELDPELIALPRRRTRVGAVLVISVVVLSVYLMIVLRSDLAYSFVDHTPKELGAATGNVDNWPDNQLVAIQSMPDRSAPLAIEDKTWNRVMPFLGTSRSVWLRAVGERRNENPPYDERYVGRLRRLDGLKLADRLATRLAKRPALARFLNPRQLAKGVPGRDLAGDKIAIVAATLAQIDETVATVVHVVLYRGKAIPDLDQATAALVAAELVVGGAPKPVASDERSWTFEVPSPDGIDAVRIKVVGAKLYAASVRAKKLRHKLPFADITPQPDGLNLGNRTVPFESIDRLAVFVKMDVADNAFVLLENEMPEQYWYLPFLYGGLLLVSLWLVFILVRGIRDHANNAADAQDNDDGAGRSDDSATATV